MELAPLETLARLAIGLMPNLAIGQCEQRINRRFRSFFGASIGACEGLWLLCCDDFGNLITPARLLRTLTLLKQRSTEETSAARAGVHEDAFRCCAWRALTEISGTEFASAARNRAVPALTIF